MAPAAHEASGLAKTVWTDADYDEMGWHDATIVALSLQETDGVLPRLLFDIDYIVRWVHPAPPDQYFTFWVAPATLVFEEVDELTGDLDLTGGRLELEIADLHRIPADESHDLATQWHIEGHAFDLRLRAGGFRQFFRRVPAHVPRQTLTMAARGGVSFAETGFD